MAVIALVLMSTVSRISNVHVVALCEMRTQPGTRAFDGRGARVAVLEAVAKEALWDGSAQWPP